jgi:hypothetical protein
MSNLRERVRELREVAETIEATGALAWGVASAERRQLKAAFGDRAEAIVEALEALLDVVSESEGIIGYHLNGAIAPWAEFEFVDVAEAVLRSLTEALGVATGGTDGNTD